MNSGTLHIVLSSDRSVNVYFLSAKSANTTRSATSHVGQQNGASIEVVEDVKIHVVKILAIGIIHGRMKTISTSSACCEQSRVLRPYGNSCRSIRVRLNKASVRNAWRKEHVSRGPQGSAGAWRRELAVGSA